MADRTRRKTRIGVVVSDKRDKTIKVEVTGSRRHPLYGKVVRNRSVFHAHDEANDARLGDIVMISETRPLSKTKRWRVVEIVEKAR
ncbi:MAG: 30S ribosomal protein S17 [Acidimicrobiia bacterium]|nr:30S ribosomal protein S17 [Acidimicrobiia bacterium]